MRRTTMMKTLIAAAAVLGLTAGAVQASEGVKIPQQSWDFAGPFGTFDRAALKRGYQIYDEICSGCHSLNLVAYRNLTALGLTEDEVKELAAAKEVPAAPNEEGATHDDEGNRLMRPALPADHFVAPYANKQAAMSANSGAVPPDLSLMTKARKDGRNYVFALLTGYKDEAPEGVTIPEGKYFNEYFPGHAISMAPPLSEEAVEYADGTKATLEQEAKDIVTFLTWAAQPEMEQRKQMGLKVLIFLVVLTAMLYALKRKIWSDVH
ncbi:MAG: cytochrome c1 [Hyphomicrobiales bacterium]|nr:cytochrome c1 [Hyphomicrobiales bacterium]